MGNRTAPHNSASTDAAEWRAATIAARPAPGRPLAADEVELNLPADMRPRLRDGEALRIVGRGGIACVVRLSFSPSSDSVPRVRLGRGIWRPVGARPGDELLLSAAAVPAARRVVVGSPVKFSAAFEEQLRQWLRSVGLIASAGSLVLAPMFGGRGELAARILDAEPDPGRVDEDTEVVLMSGDHHVHSDAISFADVGGADGVRGELRSLVLDTLERHAIFRTLGIRPPRGVLLSGPPGTGKTMAMRAIAAEVDAHVVAAPAPELVGSYAGETESALRKIFAEALAHAPSLICLDEIDVLASRRDQLASMNDVRVASQLLSLMDGLRDADGFLVLATTNRLDAIDEAFRRPGRFDAEVTFTLPTAAERREILAVHTRDMPLTAAAEMRLDRFAMEESAALSGADLMSVASKIGVAAFRRSRIEADSGADMTPLRVDTDDVSLAIAGAGSSVIRGADGEGRYHRVPHWQQLIADPDAKAALASAGETALDPQRRAEGVLVCGAPGSGKSTLVNSYAQHVGLTLVEIDGSALYTQWLGESEAQLRRAFVRARQALPAIVVIDHLDVVAPRRSGSDGSAGVDRRVLAALLSEIDQSLDTGSVLVIGVTDRPDLVDDAVKRTGRLGWCVELPPPNAALRASLIRSVLRSDTDGGYPLSGDAHALVAATEGQSVADVVRAAHRLEQKTTRKSAAGGRADPASGGHHGR